MGMHAIFSVLFFTFGSAVVGLNASIFPRSYCWSATWNTFLFLNYEIQVALVFKFVPSWINSSISATWHFFLSGQLKYLLGTFDARWSRCNIILWSAVQDLSNLEVLALILFFFTGYLVFTAWNERWWGKATK